MLGAAVAHGTHQKHTPPGLAVVQVEAPHRRPQVVVVCHKEGKVEQQQLEHGDGALPLPSRPWGEVG